ncbi:hypothetical protein [Pseudanabaena sp. UWO310]|uniref:hypothetical protein n=1 Tax=Pseudanabaena sp. UWO310 TaxID=2480795 RepID=UPI001681AF12|nr:hypothetical protein [Pseudanabaena sp. UWO310]
MIAQSSTHKNAIAKPLTKKRDRQTTHPKHDRQTNQKHDRSITQTKRDQINLC